MFALYELRHDFHDFAVGRRGHDDYVEFAVVDNGRRGKPDVPAERDAVAHSNHNAVVSVDFAVHLYREMIGIEFTQAVQ